MNFYSARLLYIILIDDGKPKKKNRYDEIVIVFRSREFKDAFERAIGIGKSREQNYKNGKGQDVRWALVRVVNLDWVGRKVDGKEVASNLHHRTSSAPVLPDTEFHPERTQPEGSF